VGRLKQAHDYGVLFELHLFSFYPRPNGVLPLEEDPSKELQLGLVTVLQQNTSTLPRQWTDSYIAT